MVRPSLDLSPGEEQKTLDALNDLPLGEIRIFESTTSTNDIALKWASEGARDMSLVIAGEQTAGRGRGNRKWYTPPGAALAFSLVLRLKDNEGAQISRFTGLGPLAVSDALQDMNLAPEIKWPNDILLGGRKTCGILVESIWQGETVEALVMGIGINLRRESVPPAELLNFPATCVEMEAGHAVQKLPLLHHVLRAISSWRPQLATHPFLHTWENRLAFRGEQVEIVTGEQPSTLGRLEGLNQDGSLRLELLNGKKIPVTFGDVHLRPVL